MRRRGLPLKLSRTLIFLKLLIAYISRSETCLNAKESEAGDLEKFTEKNRNKRKGISFLWVK